MLEFITGRAKSGKSTDIINKICDCARLGIKGQILIVPEQYSHDTERRLLELGGNGISLYAEVLTFTRLTNRVFALEGGLARRYLDEGGRILAMNRALFMIRDKLRVFKTPSGKAEFLVTLIEAVDELKSCLITPEKIKNAAGGTKGGFSDKLFDLAMIYETYEALSAQTDSDPASRLDILAEKLRASSYLDDKYIYMDGFTDFTPQEMELVKIMAKKAREVSAAFTYTEDENMLAAGVFTAQRRTLELFSKYAEKEKIVFQIKNTEGGVDYKRPEFRHIERELFNYRNPVYDGTCAALNIFSADNPYSECMIAASYILKLIREEGYKFNDIAVAVRNYERYAGTLETVFERYGIPVFADDLSDVAEKPVLSLITSALDAVSGGFEYEQIFKYIKTGLLDISPDESHLLENYVLKWSLRGSAWTREKPWTENPRGYVGEFTEEDIKKLGKINEIRARVRTPLMKLKYDCAGNKTALGQASALYAFIQNIRLPEILKGKTEDFIKRGELKLAEEYSQLWEILINAIDQCVAVLGEISMDIEDFAPLFKLVISACKVATIPVSLDRVSVGEALRTGQKNIKCLFILGADDGEFPPPPKPEGVFSDDERSELAKLGLSMPETSQERLCRELFSIYHMFLLPRDRLYISYAVSDGKGNEKRPSFTISRLTLLFPELKVISERELKGQYKLCAYSPCLELAASKREENREHEASILAYECISQNKEYRSLLERIDCLSDISRGPISPDAVSGLYGRALRLSASRIDKLSSCRFSYFMKYGLNAQPRIQAGFKASEIGTFIHYVLENVTKSVMAAGGAEKISDGELQNITNECVKRYAHEMLAGLEGKTARFVYLFKRLVPTVEKLVQNMTEELAASDFKPVGFELEFKEGGMLPPMKRIFDGTELFVSGLVDRADAWEKDGKLYMRVLDYKTGEKSFRLSDIWHGLGMQLLIYLFVLRENGENIYGKEVVTAGVLYIPAREVMVQATRGTTDEELKRLLRRRLARSGIILDNADVIAAMEHDIKSEAEYLPIKKNMDGSFSADSSLITLERFEKLRSHVDRVLKNIAMEIKAGNIEANPYYKNAKDTACAYCEFKSACQFDMKNGKDRPRYLSSLKDGEFWQLVEAESGPRNGGVAFG